MQQEPALQVLGELGQKMHSRPRLINGIYKAALNKAEKRIRNYSDKDFQLVKLLVYMTVTGVVVLLLG